MSKSNSKNSRKKRDKRRQHMNRASAVRNWESLDVSGWFDTRVGFEQNDLETFYPDENHLTSPFYKDTLPGEYYFSFYAHEHPEKEDETVAVRLVKNWYACNNDSEAGKAYSALRKPLLDDLSKLAKQGCVTANCFLGHLYKEAEGVRKNTDKAREYLQFAAENGDPLGCYLFWTVQPMEEDDSMLRKSAEYGCPIAVRRIIFAAYDHGFELTPSELYLLTNWLAALAIRGSWKCLELMINFLRQPLAAELRDEFAPIMTTILKRLADAGLPIACEYFGRALLEGILLPKNLDGAEHMLQRACKLGAKDGPFFYAQSLLSQAKDNMRPKEEREGRLKAAREVLEEQSRNVPDDYLSKGQLGLVLVSSESDDDFAMGMQYLNEVIPHNLQMMSLKAARFILNWSANVERQNAVLKMLNRLVRRKDRDAFFVLGRYYLLGGLKAMQDIAKGMEMLHQAVELGSGEACLLLCEIYLFGFFQVDQDTAKAMEFLRAGIELGFDKCCNLLALITLGEISEFTDEPDNDAILNARQLLMKNYTDRDEYVYFAFSLMSCGADNALTRRGVQNDFTRKPAFLMEELAITVARRCTICMMKGMFGPLGYFIDALKRLASTKYAPLFVEAFAKETPFMQGNSLFDGPVKTLEAVHQRLYFFFSTMPSSFWILRDTEGEKFRKQLEPVVY